MADGTQREFNIPRHLPQTRLRPGEIVVDLFAGGGGASVALEAALRDMPGFRSPLLGIAEAT